MLEKTVKSCCKRCPRFLSIYKHHKEIITIMSFFFIPQRFHPFSPLFFLFRSTRPRALVFNFLIPFRILLLFIPVVQCIHFHCMLYTSYDIPQMTAAENAPQEQHSQGRAKITISKGCETRKLCPLFFY